jgi:hypothetical protein
MLRIAGLALLFVIGAATPAEANDGDAGERTATVRHQRTADPGPKPSVQERTTPVQLPKALSIAPLALQGTSLTGFRHELMTPATGLAALLAARRAGDDLSWVSQGKSGLELPVTVRLSLPSATVTTKERTYGAGMPRPDPSTTRAMTSCCAPAGASDNAPLRFHVQLSSRRPGPLALPLERLRHTPEARLFNSAMSRAGARCA